MIRTALAAVALDHNAQIEALNAIMAMTAAETATGDFLDRIARERGLTRYPATRAIRRGEFNIDVPVAPALPAVGAMPAPAGSRFTINNLVFRAVERISPGVFKMQCETPGRAGNLPGGAMLPIDYSAGLTSARLTDVLIPGEDAESDTSLRKRYFDTLDAQAYGGNIADYKEKVGAMPGVGGVKVYPVYNGGGTVKVIFIDSEYQPPDAAHVAAVQTALDPVPFSGIGLGLAPIGHAATVSAVTSTFIDISTNIVYADGADAASARDSIAAVIDGYFTELAEQWADTFKLELDAASGAWADVGALTIRISWIESRLLALPGVEDISGTTLNGAAQNLTLAPDAIPKRGELVA